MLATIKRIHDTVLCDFPDNVQRLPILCRINVTFSVLCGPSKYSKTLEHAEVVDGCYMQASFEISVRFTRAVDLKRNLPLRISARTSRLYIIAELTLLISNMWSMHGNHHGLLLSLLIFYGISHDLQMSEQYETSFSVWLAPFFWYQLTVVVTSVSLDKQQYAASLLLSVSWMMRRKYVINVPRIYSKQSSKQHICQKICNQISRLGFSFTTHEWNRFSLTNNLTSLLMTLNSSTVGLDVKNFSH